MEERSLAEHWMVLYNRKWIILIVVLSAVAVAALLGSKLTPTYEARVVFFVPQQADRVTFFSADAPRTLSPAVPSPTPKEDAHASHIGILKSKALARRILQDFPIKRLEDLERHVDFELSDEFMLQVYVRDRDPKLAAEIANAFYKHFSRTMQEVSGETISKNQRTIEIQLKESRASLAAAQSALEGFEAGKGIADLSGQTAELVRQLSTFEASLENAKVSLTEVEKRIAGTRHELAREASLYLPTELVTTAPAIERLKKDLADLEAGIAARRNEVSERHPDLVALRAQYQAKRRELSNEIDLIIKSETKTVGSFYEDLRRSLTTLLVEKEATEAKIGGLRRAIAQIETKQTRLPEVKARHAVLTKQVEIRQRLLDTLLTDLEEAKTQEQREPQIAVLVDPAREPESPVFPIAWLNGLVAAGLGVIASIFYCFLLDYIHRVRLLRRVQGSAASRVAFEGA